MGHYWFDARRQGDSLSEGTGSYTHRTEILKLD